MEASREAKNKGERQGGGSAGDPLEELQFYTWHLYLDPINMTHSICQPYLFYLDMMNSGAFLGVGEGVSWSLCA